MSIKRFAGLVSTRWREPSTCEACGNSFDCGATLMGCWCAEVKLSERLRSTLRARYQHCLCRSCLERFAEADKVEAEVGE